MVSALCFARRLWRREKKGHRGRWGTKTEGERPRISLFLSPSKRKLFLKFCLKFWCWMGYCTSKKPLWRREFMFQLLIMKLDCLNKCKLAQDSMKCKTCETPRTSVNLLTFSVPRGQIPRILKTCIAKVLKFSQDLISGEIIFPHLSKKMAA